jgi:hypothetical protein
MIINVTVDTGVATKIFKIRGNGLTDCFSQIPLLAAANGVGLIANGSSVKYTVLIESVVDGDV